MKDIQQLIKKNNQERRYNDIFPKTYTDAVEDRGTGMILSDILAGFNMYFLPYVGSKKDTRLQVPKFLRRRGLIITYVTYDNTIISERYKQEAIDDITWGDDNNWDNLWDTSDYIRANNAYGFNVTVFGINGGRHTIETAILDVPYEVRTLGHKITFAQHDGTWATYQLQSMSLSDYDKPEKWVRLEGITNTGSIVITNQPDEEDITVDSENLLKLADKEYSESSFSGLGRVYLRKNIVDGKNVLTQEMINKANTKYIIQYDYDLNNQTITIPEGCILDFQGGTIKNGNLSGTFKVEGNYISLFLLGGNFEVDKAYLNLIEYQNKDISDILQNALNHSSIVEISKGNYIISKTIRVHSNTNVYFNNSTIKAIISDYNFDNNKYKDGSIVNVAVFAIRGVESGIDYSTFYATSGDFVVSNGIAATSNNECNENFIELESVDNLNEGDILLISEAYGSWHYLKQEINVIDSISNNTVYLKNKLSNTYSSLSNNMSNFFKEFDPVSQPGGTTEGQPNIANFVSCGVRKITPVQNVTLNDLIIDLEDSPNVSKLGLFCTLGWNITYNNINILGGRIWTTDSQDVHYNNIKTNYNSYFGNGCLRVSAYECQFNNGLQIEEGVQEATLNNCSFNSVTTTNSIIRYCRGITLVGCNIYYGNTTNNALVINKCKDVTVLNCSIIGGTSSLVRSNNIFSVEESEAVDTYENTDLIEYFNNAPTIISSYLKSGIQNGFSIYNEAGDESPLIVLGTFGYRFPSAGIVGVTNLNGVLNTLLRNLSTPDTIYIANGKKEVIGLLNSINQLDLESYTVINRGLWAGSSNGNGTEIEGSKNWTALGYRNGAGEGKLLTNGYEFALFHLNNEDYLLYKMGSGQYYRYIYSDAYASTADSTNMPDISKFGNGVCVFLTDKSIPIFKDTANNRMVTAKGFNYNLLEVGPSESRPQQLTSNDKGFQYFDTTLNKPIYWTGFGWVDSTGADVNTQNISNLSLGHLEEIPASEDKIS